MLKFSYERSVFSMMMKNHKKIAEKKDIEVIKDGIVVGSSYDFLFEGENNDYDEEYADYI